MVSIAEARRRVLDILQQAGIEDAGFDCTQLLARVLGCHPLTAEEISEDAFSRLLALAHRRAAREPLQYVLGEWDFLDVTLAVGPGVLIPRPETEEVCLAAVFALKNDKTPAVLDLCAGSGAMALGLQSRIPGAQVTAVELQADAFAYLCKNVAAYAQTHTPAPRAVQADALVFHQSLAPGSVDLVMCNPPYVTEAEYASLAPEVLQEPKAALVAPDNGLFFYRRIAQDYFAVLRPGGHIVFETGAGQGAAVQELLRQNGYTAIEIRPDAAGKSRIALGQKPAQ